MAGDAPVMFEGEVAGDGHMDEGIVEGVGEDAVRGPEDGGFDPGNGD